MGGDGDALLSLAAGRVRGCLVVTLPHDFGDAMLPTLRDTVLPQLQRHGLRGLVIDLGAVAVLDPTEFDGLRRIAGMARLLGARTVFAGLAPGIVSLLAHFGVDTTGVQAAQGTEEALQWLTTAC